MIYGIQNIVLNSPYSLLVSIILFFGIVFIGDFFQKFFYKKIKTYKYNEYSIYFSPIIGVYLVIFPLYLILIFEFYGIFFLKLSSYFLFFLGCVNIFKSKNLYLGIIKKFKFKQSFLIYSILLMYIFLFFVSASPITHSDSIDYHFLGSLNFLNTGHFQKEILPMFTLLAAVGEIPIAIGLVLGAEQLGGIIQFSSLLALIPIFFKKDRNKFFLLFILTCPITFFLASTGKPQLLFSITSLLIFIFLIEHFSKLKKREMNLYFFFGLFILSLSCLAKFSFFLSSSILVLYFFYIILRKKMIFFPLLSSLVVLLLIFVPTWIFKYQNFNSSFLELIVSPIPINIYGFKDFHDHLGGNDGDRDIFSLFFFKDLRKFSTTFGPLLLILILMINKKTLHHKLPLLMIVFFVVCVFIFGNNLNRFFYEGFLWLVFLVSITYSKKSFTYKIFKNLIYLQSTFVLLISIIFTFTIFPGSLSENYKKIVMQNNANGYQLVDWVNKKVEKKDILISTHRSISLYNNKTYAHTFTWFADPKNKKSLIYGNFLKSKKVNKIVFYGDKLNTFPFNNCLGKELFYKENVGRDVGRNPFREGEYYNGWIFEFKYQDLPNCLIRQN